MIPQISQIMKSEEIIHGIDRILDIWDPIGMSLHWPEMYERNNTSGEYTRYVKPIIDAFIANESICNHMVVLGKYLIGIDVEMKDWEQARSYTIQASESIISFLSKYTMEELKEASNFSSKKL